MIAVKHIIRYLAGTRDLAIRYRRDRFDKSDPIAGIPTGYTDHRG